MVHHGSTPEKFRILVEKYVEKVNLSRVGDEKLIFVKSWNEWAEGNYLEPDLENGKKYIEKIVNYGNGCDV